MGECEQTERGAECSNSGAEQRQQNALMSPTETAVVVGVARAQQEGERAAPPAEAVTIRNRPSQ
jgi:hypothetical protein